MEELQYLEENSVCFYASIGKITADMDVFYNPVMKTNRDISIAFLNALKRPEKSLSAVDLMAGSGIRTLRMLKECPAIGKIIANDMSATALETLKRNLSANHMQDDKRIMLSQEDAIRCLSTNGAFDYIDVDPFGTPNRFLPMAIERTKHKGYLAITATDTSALAGTYKMAGIRKYWGVPLRNELMHEVGIRILIRKVQLLASSLERAMIPLYVFSTDHYIRLFFENARGKKKADDCLLQHKYLLYCETCGERKISEENVSLCCEKKMQAAGPLWTGPLWNASLAQKIAELSPSGLTKTIAQEAKLLTVGFFDLHKLAKLHHTSIARTDRMTQALMTKGWKVSRTHFVDTALRTDCPHAEFMSTYAEVLHAMGYQKV
jgi:tRNA (guanine26-N2/guanine27-N2)-dimethyltransferase